MNIKHKPSQFTNVQQQTINEDTVQFTQAHLPGVGMGHSYCE